MPDMSDAEKTEVAGAAHSAVAMGIVEMTKLAIGGDVERSKAAFAAVLFGAIGGCVCSMAAIHKEAVTPLDVNEMRSRLMACVDSHLKDHFPDWHGAN